jgi:hypothetical protein
MPSFRPQQTTILLFQIKKKQYFYMNEHCIDVLRSHSAAKSLDQFQVRNAAPIPTTYECSFYRRNEHNLYESW